MGRVGLRDHVAERLSVVEGLEPGVGVGVWVSIVVFVTVTDSVDCVAEAVLDPVGDRDRPVLRDADTVRGRVKVGVREAVLVAVGVHSCVQERDRVFDTETNGVVVDDGVRVTVGVTLWVHVAERVKLMVRVPECEGGWLSARLIVAVAVGV